MKCVDEITASDYKDLLSVYYPITKTSPLHILSYIKSYRVCLKYVLKIHDETQLLFLYNTFSFSVSFFLSYYVAGTFSYDMYTAR